MSNPKSEGAKPEKILVTGASGYVGGRLIPRLLGRGYKVRAAGRSLAKLQSRPWAKHPNLELVMIDVLEPSTLEAALEGCEVVYYFVHSMLPGQKDFRNADRLAASNFISAADNGGIKRIIYLGGLGEDSMNLSKHLKSRAEVAQILRSGRIPLTVLRAAMIIGSGSASFEILRYLVERLPVMITPRWLETKNQPIAIRNVIEYLIGCLEHPETAGQTFDIGGAEILTYRELMFIYAKTAGLPKRLIIPVPVLTPRLSSYWIHLVTPVPASIARPLAEGLSNPVVCKDTRIRKIIKQDLFDCSESICRALNKVEKGEIVSHWTDAGGQQPMEVIHQGDPEWAGGTHFEDKREVSIACNREAVWSVIKRIGGQAGWYHADFLWILRGFLDRMVGGVGLRRGRRDPNEILPGDALDFWRVADVRTNERLVLVAEMKLPGVAILEFSLSDQRDGEVILRQTAKYYPKGLLGILYWYAVLPFHGYVFQGMIQKIKEIAKIKHESKQTS